MITGCVEILWNRIFTLNKYFLLGLSGVIFKNENKNEDMLSILQQFHTYLPHSPDNGCDSQLFSGDQLTVERAVNIISLVPNGYTPKDRLDRITLPLGDWHAGVKILSVSRVQSIEIKYCLYLYMEAKPQ